MKGFLAVFALVGFLIPSSSRAATINVTSTADSGAGSLRDAIAAASSGDTVNISVTGTIILTGGPLTITKSLTISGPGASDLAVSGNKTSQVFVVNSGATVTISGLTIENGVATSGAGGGGISNSGMLTVTNSAVTGNTTDMFGGGIKNFGTLTLNNSTVSGNSASCCFGGGIYNGATLTVTNSTISGNSVQMFFGGAIYNTFLLSMTNGTVSGNTAGCCHGGGIATTGTVTVKNTILANSLASGNCYKGSGGVFASQGHNLSDDASCSVWLTDTGDANSTPAGLDPAGLKDNGGGTQTIALVPGSAAVDTVPMSPINYCTLTDGITSITTDQRGVARPGGSACDIGAFELVQTITVIINIKPGEGPAPINTKSKGTIPVAVLSSATFDAFAQVDQTSLTFGRAGSEKSLAFCSGPQDVNGDGLLDLVCHFDTPSTQFQAGDSKGNLKGKTLGGNTIMGTDSVVIVH
jgi:hypothetical protein